MVGKGCLFHFVLFGHFCVAQVVAAVGVLAAGAALVLLHFVGVFGSLVLGFVSVFAGLLLRFVGILAGMLLGLVGVFLLLGLVFK